MRCLIPAGHGCAGRTWSTRVSIPVLWRVVAGGTCVGVCARSRRASSCLSGIGRDGQWLCPVRVGNWGERCITLGHSRALHTPWRAEAAVRFCPSPTKDANRSRSAPRRAVDRAGSGPGSEALHPAKAPRFWGCIPGQLSPAGVAPCVRYRARARGSSVLDLRES
jgi:hypothetical protein